MDNNNQRKILEVYQNKNDESIETKLFLFSGMDTILIGLVLASITRIAAESFCRVMKLDKSQTEQLEAQIAEVYNRDLIAGNGQEKITIEKKNKNDEKE